MEIIKSLTGLGILTTSFFAGSANAIPFTNGATVYKTVVSGVTTVYISGTANSQIPVDLGLVEKSSSKIAGSCGEVRLNYATIGSASSIKVDGTTVNISSLATQLLPACNNGTFNETRPNNFKTPAGDVVIVGKTKGSAVALIIPKPTTKQVSLNGCGFGTLKNSSTFTIPASFSVSGTAKTLAALPTVNEPPVCRNNVGYRPANWTSQSGGYP